MKVYHLAHSRSLRVLWLLEELSWPYEIERLAFPPGADYAGIMPGGAVPAIDDGGVVLSESIAILQYLTSCHPAGADFMVALSAGKQDHASFLQFLNYGESSLANFLSAIIRTRLLAPADERMNYTVADQTKQFARRLDLLSTALADQRTFITGSRLTIADISIWYALHLASMMKLDLPEPVSAYSGRLNERPALQRALSAG